MVTNSGYAFEFNESSAAQISIRNLNFPIERNDASIPSKVLKFANVQYGRITGCDITLTSASNLTNTCIWLAGCVHNFTVDGNILHNLTESNPDGGGCFWVSGINGYSVSPDSICRNITCTNNDLVQNSGDDAIALFGRQGIMDGIRS